MAEKRDGIAAEPPIDVERQAANWQLDGTLRRSCEDILLRCLIPPSVSCPHRYLPETAAPALPRPRGSSVLGPRRRFEVDQGSVIVPETVMTAPAARLTRPVPPPLAPANLPVPPTIVCVISNHCGAFAPAADEFPGEITPTMLS
jgi:hypothetical protein